MASHRVGVFPASGGIGGSTVKHLLPRLPAQDLVFIARNPAKLDFASAAGATVRKADYDDDKALEHAFDGIETLFLISYASVEVEHRAEVGRSIWFGHIHAEMNDQGPLIMNIYSATELQSTTLYRVASSTSSMGR